MRLEIKVAAENQTDLDSTALGRHRRLSEKVADLEAAYSVHLENLRRQHPDFDLVVKKLEANKKMWAESKKELENEARSRAESFRGEGVSVSFSNPMRVEYDAAELLKRHPQAAEIKNLVKSVVDNETLECAVAAGWIPQRVADAVKTEEPMYKKGRVQVKILKS